MPIFPTPINLDADYQWAGLHTFEFIATFEGGIETEQITSVGGLTTTLASGGQGQYFFGANPIYLMSATEFRPAEALTAVTLGSATRRWTDFFSIDGSFSGNLNSELGGSVRAYQLGTEGDTDSRYLMFSEYGIQQVKTGAAGNEAWSFGSITTGAGIEFHANGSQIMLESNFGQNIKIAAGYNSIGVQTFPRLTNTYPLGTDANRWSNVASVDGDFSGNITAENLPTSDPGVPGQFYVTTGGALKVSQ